MKLQVLLLFPLFLLLGCQQSAEKAAITRQLQDYPESRVQDIYKSFCQDNLGPEHLIPNPEAARNYLMSELENFRDDLASHRYDAPQRMYYPVGDQGNYVRVDLYTVLTGLVSEQKLLDAFVRSANEGHKVALEEWVAKWNGIAAIIRKDFSDIPGAEEDLARIDALLKEGDLILHHSDAFGEAYQPHYRIVARDIFESELKPLIER
ncbi:MAG: hypothetical protein IJK19_05710 [Bacteroidales bacterium]|nr:hypothetical protein [Bacteroidales bacterium]